MMNTNFATTMLVLVSINFSCSHGQSIKSTDSNACIIAEKIDSSLNNINKNAKAIIDSSKDDCVMRLLDTLTIKAINSDENKYLMPLESLRKVSDGYVSEYFLEIGVKLFYKDFKDYVLYIFNRRMAKENYLEKVMVEAISMEMSDSDNIENYQKKIDEFINKEIQTFNFSKEQLAYINGIKKKFDPKLFD